MLIQEFSRILVGGLARSMSQHAANVLERIPYSGIARETSSGSFDSATYDNSGKGSVAALRSG